MCRFHKILGVGQKMASRGYFEAKKSRWNVSGGQKRRYQKIFRYLHKFTYSVLGFQSYSLSKRTFLSSSYPGFPRSANMFFL